VRQALAACGVPFERTGDWSYVVTLPGSARLSTRCNLVVGEHALRIEAFVLRQPDENREQLWSFLLQRNARMFGVAFATDRVGDVYLVGRMPLGCLDATAVDRLLGAVLEAADANFNAMLEIGFGTAIRREWAWRVARGEPLDNLRAFAHFAAPTARPGQGASGSDADQG
jgi:hypothetical protein